MGSVAKCEMLYRSNLLAVVAGGTRPMFSDNILLIFDDLTKKFILEISFASTIHAVRLRKDKIIVALLHQIHIFSFPSPVQRLFSVETIANPRGILELSPLGTGDKQILVFPGHKIGSVQIVVSAQQILLTLWIAQFESGSGVYGEGRVLRPRLDQRPQGRNRLRGVQPRGDQNRNRVRPRHPDQGVGVGD
jgi:hypothetical protein